MQKKYSLVSQGYCTMNLLRLQLKIIEIKNDRTIPGAVIFVFFCFCHTNTKWIRSI